MIRKGEEFTFVFREVRREREKIRRRINLLDLPQLFCFHGVDLVEKDVNEITGIPYVEDYKVRALWRFWIEISPA